MTTLLTITGYYNISTILFTIFMNIEIHKVGMENYINNNINTDANSKSKIKKHILALMAKTTNDNYIAACRKYETKKAAFYAVIPFYRVYALIKMCKANV